MSEPSDKELFDAVRRGQDAAFERVYDLYRERTRLMAWRISHRPDWIDELVNETWCRAFKARLTYDDERPFLVWYSGILRNVYREHCRQSPTTMGDTREGSDSGIGGIDSTSPEDIVSEVELLAALSDCVGRLNEVDRRIVHLRFFDGLPLRSVGQEVRIPESTLREHRLPAILSALRQCLGRKGIDLSQIFPQVPPAQLGGGLQYLNEEPS